jgi:hypothetical protein
VFALGKQHSDTDKNSPDGPMIGTTSILPGVQIGRLVTNDKNCLRAISFASNNVLVRYNTVDDDFVKRRIKSSFPISPSDSEDSYTVQM